MSKAKDEIFFENTSPIRMKSIPKYEGANQEQNNVLLEQYEPEMTTSSTGAFNRKQ